MPVPGRPTVKCDVDLTGALQQGVDDVRFVQIELINNPRANCFVSQICGGLLDQRIKVMKELMKPFMLRDAKREIGFRDPPNKKALKGYLVESSS